MKIEARIIEVAIAKIDETSCKYAFKVEYRIDFGWSVGRWLFHSIHADKDIAEYVKNGIEDQSIPVIFERPRTP